MVNDGGQLVIAGKYQLLRQLGRGAMGSVWQARHLTLRSSVAVKLMDPAIGLSSTGLSRFLREARAAAELRSPHVVQILDHGVDQGTPYIVMEMLEGETLASRLGRVGRLAPRETARIVSHIARALSRAERAGVVHRDLKPDNVFLVRNEDEDMAKVLDFGIAKVLESTLGQSFSEESTAAGVLIGTPYYVSPEQAEGLKSLDHRTDIWSLGVMTYECLLGERPFDADTLPALLLAICSNVPPVPSARGSVPAGFDAWFARACAREPAARFASARDASAQLLAICSGSVQEAAWPSSSAPPPRPLSVPKLQRADATEDDEDDEAPTEIWREAAIERILGDAAPPAPALAAPPAPTAPAQVGPAPTAPARVAPAPTAPAQVALANDGPRKIESKGGFSATARHERARPRWAIRAAALGAFAALGSGIGLWLGAQSSTPSALPLAVLSGSRSVVAPPAAASSAVSAKSAAPDLPAPIDPRQLPLVSTPTPAGKTPAAAPSASARPTGVPVGRAPLSHDNPRGADSEALDSMSNPYR